MTNTNLICGIDTLYYFVETNKNYDDLFLDILDQVEDKKALYERGEIEYLNTDIFIEVENIPLQFLNKAEGFYWFKDINEFFRIGFKDEQTNKKLNNIRVQLQGVGIYTIGLKPLISFINDNLFQEVSTGFYPITRADLNCFINYDFSYINKTMFASKKKRYMSISEFGSANKIETIYVGKAPFMLRLYNKKLELSKAANTDKKEMMFEYFANNGLDMELPIFNVEFEMHRTHLRGYSITTLDDLLSNANNLFKKAMEEIRLIDVTTITEKDIKNNSKNRAQSLPIWEHVKESFNIDAFLQLDFPIKRLKRKESTYHIDNFIEDFNLLIKKARPYSIHITSEFLSTLLHEYFDQEEKDKKEYAKSQEIKKNYTEFTIDGIDKTYRLLDNGDLISPFDMSTLPEFVNVNPADKEKLKSGVK